MQFSTWIVPYEIFCASASSDKGKCLSLLFCNLGKSISRIAALCSRSCPVSRSIAAGRLLVRIALCVIRCASRIRSIAVLGLSVTVQLCCYINACSLYAVHRYKYYSLHNKP